jgi:hypothetical protein
MEQENRDRTCNLHKQLTHEEMKNSFLSGDAIDGTTRGDQEDYEIDRMPGNANESLVQLPTEKHSI